MRILIVTSLYPPIVGGVSTYCYNLQNKLKFLKYNVTVVYEKKSKPLSKIRLFISAILTSIKISPEVIHAHSNWHSLFPAIIYKRFKKSTKVVFTFHTWGRGDLSDKKKRRFERLLSRCDEVTFVSKGLKAEIERDLEITAPKYIVYTGVESKSPTNEDISRFLKDFKVDDKITMITAIGPFEWLEKVRGISKLIDAFSIVLNDYPTAKLVLIGDGKYRTKLEKRVEDKGIIRQVIFTGYHNVFVPLYLTDIYAHISLQEGLPIALLEAMAMKRPVIATPVGGIPEVIQDGKNGMLVSPEPEEIAKGIITLLNDSNLRTSLAEEGYLTAKQKFNWEKTAKEFTEIYRGER
jgi:glycosyltransferase involved in cell wall biosynthesis